VRGPSEVRLRDQSTVPAGPTPVRVAAWAAQGRSAAARQRTLGRRMRLLSVRSDLGVLTAHGREDLGRLGGLDLHETAIHLPPLGVDLVGVVVVGEADEGAGILN